MTINQLQYYVEIVNQKNFTRAAEKLFVSQSTLSKSVRALEREFQAELINHNAKDFMLTSDGMLFYEYAVKILDYFDTQTHELHQRLSTTHGLLNIGIPPTAGTTYFYSLIHKYREQYPDINLNLLEVPSQLILKEMDANRLDMGAVLEPFPESSQYFVRPVCRSEIVLTVSKDHPLAGRESVSFSELRGEKFLMVSSDFTFHHIVLSLCGQAGLVPNIIFESSQWDLIYAMTNDNQGISFFPLLFLEKQNDTRLKRIHLENPEAPWTLAIAYRKDKFVTKPMQLFLDLCDKV